MNTFFFNDKQTLSRYKSTKVIKSLEIPIKPLEASVPILSKTENFIPKDIISNNEIGFIILRHVNSVETNEYWKESYRCIKKFYPSNKILIIDDNSDKNFLKSEDILLDNTTIIQSEYPQRGEFLPYYYYLKNKFCDIAVIIHDSVFIQRPINFNVDEYKMLWHFNSYYMIDGQSSPKQLEQIKALNHSGLNYLYENFYFNKFNGCFGAMAVIKHSYLNEINNVFKIDKLIPYIKCRVSRCAFERIITFLLIYKEIGSGVFYKKKYKHQSILGDIKKYCKWGITFDEYIKYRHIMNFPVIKVWTGR